MKQDRLNHLAIIYVYSDIVEKLDLTSVIDNFISKNNKRMTTFALSRNMKNK